MPFQQRLLLIMIVAAAAGLTAPLPPLSAAVSPSSSSTLEFDLPLGFTNDNTPLDLFQVQYPVDSFAQPNLDTQSHTIDLTANSGYKDNVRRYNVGRLRYSKSLTFPYGRFPSFNTSFTFLIETSTGYNESGDGIAFALTSDGEPPSNSTGRFLGLTPEDTNLQHDHYFIAVEFDTFQNFDPGFHDPSASHIGVDINNLASSANVLDTSPNSSSGKIFPYLYLYRNYTIKAWVEYDASLLRIRVYATNVSVTSESLLLISRPSSPCLEMNNVNLSEKIPVTQLYAVITAASGNNTEGHVLYAWNFRSSNLADDKNPTAKNVAELILAIVAGLQAMVIAVMAVFIICLWRRRRLVVGATATVTAAALPSFVDSDAIIQGYSYDDFQRACNDFAAENVVGEGGWGIVYRGVLSDGREVAVKKMKQVALQKDFYREVHILRSMDHPNLLLLLAWRCRSGGGDDSQSAYAGAGGTANGMLLVYPYMKNGSLDKYVGSGNVRVSRRLGGARRLEVVCQVAAALEYLHGRRCVHRDVKPSNVLLTEDFDAKVADFGLAREGMPESPEVTVTEAAAGTPGYLAPELANVDGRLGDTLQNINSGMEENDMSNQMDDTGRNPQNLYRQQEDDIDSRMGGVWVNLEQKPLPEDDLDDAGGWHRGRAAAAQAVSYKADVYSFGVLALKVASGRMYTWADIPRLGSALQMSMDCFDHSDFLALLDPVVREDAMGAAELLQQWRCVFLVALRCLSPSPSDRPTMAKVSQALRALIRLGLPDILDSIILQL